MKENKCMPNTEVSCSFLTGIIFKNSCDRCYVNAHGVLVTKDRHW